MILCYEAKMSFTLSFFCSSFNLTFILILISTFYGKFIVFVIKLVSLL